MDLPPPTPSSAATPQGDWRRDALRDLAEICANLTHIIEHAAQALVADATPQHAAEQLPGLIQSFTRLARSLRQTASLDYKLEHHHRTLRSAAETTSQTRAQSRRKLIRDIENAIALSPSERRENLLADFYERLADPTLDEDLAARPIGEIIRDLRDDLGVPTPCGQTPPPRSLEAIRALADRAQAAIRAVAATSTGPP